MTRLFARAVRLGSEVAYRVSWLAASAGAVAVFVAARWAGPLAVAAFGGFAVAVTFGVLAPDPDGDTSPTALSNTT